MEQRAGIDEHAVVVGSGGPAGESRHRDKVAVAEHRAGRSIDDRSGIDDQQRVVWVDFGRHGFGPAGGDQILITARHIGIMLNPLGPLACQFARSSDALTDLLLLPDDDPRIEVVDDESELVAGLPPVHRADHRAEPSMTASLFG